jgi:hypothetical protein
VLVDLSIFDALWVLMLAIESNFQMQRFQVLGCDMLTHTDEVLFRDVY